MKAIFVLFFVLVLLALKADAAPPLGVSGQNQSNIYPSVIQVPNNLVTNLGSGKALLESGNDNILSNPGFEHSIFNTGWVNTAGTFTVESGAANLKDGKKAAKLVTSAQFVETYQDSSLYAASSVGVAGTISGWISNTAPNVYFCQRIATAWVKDTDSTEITNCRKVNQTSVFTEYSMPVILGATSNGAGFISLDPLTALAATTTGTTYFDKIKVAAGQSFESVSPNLQSSSFVAGSTANGVAFTGTPTTKGAGNYSFSAGTFTALRDIQVTMSCGSTNSTTSSSAVNIIVSGGGGMASHGDSAIANRQTTTSWTGSLISGQTILCQSAGTTAASGRVVISSVSDNPSSATSQSADSFSTDTNVLTHKTTAIDASDPVGTYNTYSYATSSNTKTVCATLPTTLPSFASGALIHTRAYNAASTCLLPARYEVKIGTGMRNVQSTIYKSSAKVNAGTLDKRWANSTTEEGAAIESYDDVTGIITIDAGNNINSATTTSFFRFGDTTSQASGYLVINAQKKKDWMVGDISGLEKCATTLECTDTFSASVAYLNPVSNENVDWINGNAVISDTSLYTLTLNSSIPLTLGMNCQVTTLTNDNTVAWAARIETQTVSTIGVRIGYATAAVNWTKSPTSFKITCQKQGADYIGKTAKAVASDQNDRTPGVVGAKTCRYLNGGATVATTCTASPCTEYEDNCSAFSPCTRSSTGSYSCTMANGTFANNSNMQCAVQSNIPQNRVLPMYANASGGATLTIESWTVAGSVFDTYFSVSCKGVSP